MLKKRFLTFGIAVLMLFSLVGLTDCGNGKKIVETDYFRAELNKKDGYAIVLELTELGKEQEILAVPMFVEGLPVKQIGGNRKIWYEGDSIHSQNLTKLYIPHSVEKISSRIETAHNSEIVVMLVDTPNGYFNYILGDLDIIHLNNKIAIHPNVAFLYNYPDAPNQGYYWFDYITGTNQYLIPPNPTRQNYTFAGWYLEPGCETIWNERMPQSAEETLKLYAKWQAK
jgi:uncharacterized repeat protein (TIGR02543 family)